MLLGSKKNGGESALQNAQKNGGESLVMRANKNGGGQRTGDGCRDLSFSRFSCV